MEPIHLIEGAEVNNHMVIIGTSGRGKSELLQGEAMRLGITYDELLQRIGPTEEQKEVSRRMNDERKRKDEARLQAVRDAYWNASDVDGLEFSTIHDSLSEFCEFDHPTNEQIKALFDLLPSEIISNGIRWGFDDTEVRDDIYAFVRDNAESVTNTVRSL